MNNSDYAIDMKTAQERRQSSEIFSQLQNNIENLERTTANLQFQLLGERRYIKELEDEIRRLRIAHNDPF